MEAKPNNPGCKGLPSASWSVVLIFNTPEQCVRARQEVDKARRELLDKRSELVRSIVQEQASGQPPRVASASPPAVRGGEPEPEPEPEVQAEAEPEPEEVGETAAEEEAAPSMTPRGPGPDTPVEKPTDEDDDDDPVD